MILPCITSPQPFRCLPRAMCPQRRDDLPGQLEESPRPPRLGVSFSAHRPVDRDGARVQIKAAPLRSAAPGTARGGLRPLGGRPTAAGRASGHRSADPMGSSAARSSRSAVSRLSGQSESRRRSPWSGHQRHRMRAACPPQAARRSRDAGSLRRNGRRWRGHTANEFPAIETGYEAGDCGHLSSARGVHPSGGMRAPGRSTRVELDAPGGPPVHRRARHLCRTGAGRVGGDVS